jgi:hypothetical protein
LHWPSQLVSSSKKKTAWGKILGANAIGAGSSNFGIGSNTYFSNLSHLNRRNSVSALLEAARTCDGLGIGFALSSYLDSDIIKLFDDYFNILNWWHEHK